MQRPPSRPEQTKPASRWKALWSDVIATARGFLLGTAFAWLSTMQTLRRRGEMEHIFAVVLFCDLHGLPLLPWRAHLRVLPYMVPQILTWRRANVLWSDELESAARHLHH